jgi:hypothetical protein
MNSGRTLTAAHKQRASTASASVQSGRPHYYSDHERLHRVDITNNQQYLDTAKPNCSWPTMAQPNNNRLGQTGSEDIGRTSMDSDSAFHATPINAPAAPITTSTSPKISDYASKNDSTFMQNQISIQRSPSAVKDQATALSRKLSIKSNDSHGSNDANQAHLGIASVLSSIPQVDERTERGRFVGDSPSSIIEATNACTLSKSSSERVASRYAPSTRLALVPWVPFVYILLHQHALHPGKLTSA